MVERANFMLSIFYLNKKYYYYVIRHGSHTKGRTCTGGTGKGKKT
jgi:hypothetical protein